MTQEEFQQEAVRLRPMLLKAAKGYLHNDADSEDAVQTVLVRPWTMVDNVRRPTVKESHKGIHVNPVTIDLMATLRAPFGNYYFKYSPSHLVKDGWGLRFHTLSFGVFL